MLLTASTNHYILVYHSSTKSVTLCTEKTRAAGFKKTTKKKTFATECFNLTFSQHTHTYKQT